MSTIPLKQIVSIVKGVVSGGGAASALSGLILTQDASIPAGQVAQFYDAPSVSTWFGPSSPEAQAASVYFPGIVNGGQLPFVLKFAQYALTAQAATVFGAQLGSLTLATLKTFTGTLIVTTTAQFTSSTINLSAATDFANAASIMTAAFTTPNFAITYDATRGRFLLKTTATGATATVSAVTGTLATNVGLSAAAGAQTQNGVDADTPSSAMSRVVTLDTNWGLFTTAWAAVLADRQAFAVWNGTQNSDFLYVSYDMEPASIVANNAASFGAIAFATPYQGTMPVYGDLGDASLVLAWAASVNFNVTNGRATAAFRQSAAGITPKVTDLATANALLSNNYSYYGAYANAANTYSILYDGGVSGQYLWSDTYIDQIYLNRELQRSQFEGMLAYNSLPYNNDGYELLYASGLPVLQAALASGIIRTGVTLSAAQIAQINQQAGKDIASTLQTQGFYYLIGDPANPAQARQNRTTPGAQLWYADGGSIQSLTIQSRAVI
jgi:hypothetical protein